MSGQFHTVQARIDEYRLLLDKLMGASALPFDKDLRRKLPTTGGVYLITHFEDGMEQMLYVGKSINLQQRIYQNHLMGSQRQSTLKRSLIKSGEFKDETFVKEFLRNSCFVRNVVLTDKRQRNGFEHYAIAALWPRFNV